MFDADTRLSAIAFWQVLVFGLNATLFVLLGLQFEGVFDSVRATGDTGPLLADVALVSAVVIGVRLAWRRCRRCSARVVPASRAPTPARTGASASSSAGAGCAARSRSRGARCALDRARSPSASC